MKKIYFPIMIALALALTGCGGTSTKTGSSPAEESTQTEKADNLADMIDIQEYSCTVDDSFMYYVMCLTNNSDKVVSIEANITALDASSAMVGSSGDTTRAVAPGQTAGIWTTFDEWDKIDHFEYTLSVSEEYEYSPVYDDLSVEYNTTDTGVVAAITNNGDTAASFVWMDVVYLKDGKMVNFNELSFMDDNQELLPGVKLSAEGTCYSVSGFDDVVIAVNGRR